MSTLIHSLQDLKHTGCLLCAYEKHQAKRFLQGIANDGVNDPPLRIRLKNKGGFCAQHLQVFVTEARVLSSAILLEDMLSHRLERARLGKSPTMTICEACEVETKTRDNLAKNIRRSRDDATLIPFLLKHELCVSHIEIICHQLPERQRYPFFEKHQTLLSNLSEVIRKHDYRFVAEGINQEETQSIQATLSILS